MKEVGIGQCPEDAATAPSATGGRHDERPHGMTKMVAPKQVEAKDTAASTIAPLATTTEQQSAGL